MIPRSSCIDSYTRVFQFKILHNILFLNERLFKCNLPNTKLCCLCGLVSDTPEHLVSTCKVTKTLWTALQNKLNTSINLGPLTPQSAILGFTEKCDDFYTKNHILLIFKIFNYRYRNKFPTSAHLFGKIKAVAE